MLTAKLNLNQNIQLNFGNKNQDKAKNNIDQKHFTKNSLNFKEKKEKKAQNKSFFQRSFHSVKKFVNSILEKLGLKKPEKAVIFDMDGVIVDSIPYHNKAWIDFCHKYRPDLQDDEVKQISHGRTNKAIFTDLFQRELSDEEVNKYSKEKERIYLKGISGKIKEVDGFTRFIESLGNMKRTIATSAPAMNVKFVMNKLGLRKYFDKDKIIDASMVTKSKPDPQVYLFAAEKLGVNPEDCLVFEDAPSGIDAAKSAGMKVVGVATSLSKDALIERGADFAINDFNEINMDKVNEIIENT